MFTTSCFIRKNTPELRDTLRRMGWIFQAYREDKFWIPNSINCCAGNIAGVAAAYDVTGEPDYLNRKFPNSIDCGTNEQLFLALAALRDDTDKGQYFLAPEEGTPRICGCDHSEEYFYMSELYHKMTVNELIQYFK